jgi:N-acylneuraminate cytidylyltransferase
VEITAWIFAREGSRGVVGKNIKPFHGKPLIAWSIEQAITVSRVSRVCVSTDSKEIATISEKFGAHVPFLRPKHLATDNSPELLSWRHALSYMKEQDGKFPDIFLSMPTTAPLRRIEDVELCIEKFNVGDADAVVTVTSSHRNPYFNMVKVDEYGQAEIVNAQKTNIARRQDAPDVFDIATVAYVASPKFVMTTDQLFDGKVKVVQIPVESAIDIDTPLDFELAEYLFRKRD